MNDIHYRNIINELDQELNNILNIKKEINKEIIVLSGGGLKGIAQLGALHYLYKKKLLNNINTYSCTSIGAIIGLFMTIGYTPYEMYKFISMLELDKMEDIDPINIFKNYGMDDGNKVRIMLEHIIEAKKMNPNITFKEHYDITGYRLIITGTCINTHEVKYFDYQSCPTMRVIDAVLISIRIPLLFTPMEYDGAYYIDGGIIDNYPIRLFDDCLEKVIGIYVINKNKYEKSINSITEYLGSILNCVFHGLEKISTRWYNDQTIHINCTNLKKSKNNQKFVIMFDEGVDAARKFVIDKKL